jgi:hypothetical protein
VQKLSGEAAVTMYAASNRRHKPLPAAANFRQPSFLKLGSQIRETKNRAYGLPREDHYTPDNVPNGVRWKNLLRRRLPNPAARRKS